MQRILKANLPNKIRDIQTPLKTIHNNPYNNWPPVYGRSSLLHKKLFHSPHVTPVLLWCPNVNPIRAKLRTIIFIPLLKASIISEIIEAFQNFSPIYISIYLQFIYINIYIYILIYQKLFTNLYNRIVPSQNSLLMLVLQNKFLNQEQQFIKSHSKPSAIFFGDGEKVDCFQC